MLERHGRIMVVRDDLLEGGSKMRFLPGLIRGKKEVVYASPFCGGAAVALSLACKMVGAQATIFYAKRKNLHKRQKMAVVNGAKIYWVGPFGYMSHVFADARKYAHARGALLLQIGFDTPAAVQPFIDSMFSVRERLSAVPDEVWCAAGSGMLARCLAHTFPDSNVIGVSTGLKAHKAGKRFPSNVTLIESGYTLDKMPKVKAPFPCCPNYDLKAWEHCTKSAKGSVLFWNVMGD